jgi:hypothetical protein
LSPLNEPRGGRAGHLSGSDRAARCPTGKKPVAGSGTLAQPRRPRLLPPPALSERGHRSLARSQGFRGLDRPDREIDGGYNCVTASRTNIVLIGQSDFSGAGCSKHRWDDLPRNAFIRSPHTHHSYDVHFELKVSHGNSNATAGARPSNCTARPWPSSPRPFEQAYWQAR